MMVGPLVLPPGTVGMTEASTTLNPCNQTEDMSFMTPILMGASSARAELAHINAPAKTAPSHLIANLLPSELSSSGARQL